MVCCSFLVSQRPDVEAKIVAELDSLGLLATPERPQPRHMELDDLAEMPYFTNVCKARPDQPQAKGLSASALGLLPGEQTRQPARRTLACSCAAQHHGCVAWHRDAIQSLSLLPHAGSRPALLAASRAAAAAAAASASAPESSGALVDRQEAMRVKPVASTGSSRLTKRDLRLGGYDIPAGTLVIAPFDAVHHSPLNWDDPDAFKPVGAPSAASSKAKNAAQSNGVQ